MRRRGSTGRFYLWMPIGAAAALLLIAAVGALTTFRWATQVGHTALRNTAMRSTVPPGDVMLYEPASGLRRGDIGLQRVTAFPGASGLVMTQVIGLPGDHVSCCHPHGTLLVNGRPLSGRAVNSGHSPPLGTFSVTLRPGEYWLLGGQGQAASSSGRVPAGDMAGRVVAVVHNGSLQTVRTPQPFTAEGLAPADTRPALPVVWLLIAAAALAMMVAVSAFGTGHYLYRRYRDHRRHGQHRRYRQRTAAPAGARGNPFRPPVSRV